MLFFPWVKRCIENITIESIIVWRMIIMIMKTWWDRKNIVINENIIVKEIAIQRTDCSEFRRLFQRILVWLFQPGIYKTTKNFKDQGKKFETLKSTL
jgi:hypothetical protein